AAAGTPAASTPPDATGTAAPATAKQASAKESKSASSKRRKSTPASPAPANDGAMAIAVDAINIQDGSANYADLWIQPHFGIGIQTLNGSILGLSSNPRARAKIELQGKVDRYAPVHIWGETNPLAATGYSDIKLNFKGVELSS